jgi:hypothetical protein
MTTTAKVLVAQQNVPNAQTTAYTSPAAASGGKGTWIDKFTATNYSAGVQTISVNLVTSGDTAGNQNLVVKARSLAAGETYFFPELVGKFLGPDDFISWIASAATSINGACNGREIT